MADIEQTPSFSAEQREVIADFRAWREATNLTPEQGAHRLKCSEATLRALERGTYTGNVGKYVQRMARFLKRQRDRDDSFEPPPIVVTTVLRKLYAMCDMCWAEGAMGFACTSFGLGKTVAAERYVAANDDAILITAVEGMHRGALLDTISERMDYPVQGSGVEKLRALLAEMKRRGSPLIIIDECDFLGRTMHTLRQFHDQAGCGIVLFGTPAWLRSLRRRPDGTEGQFLSRISYQIYLDGIVEEDAEAILRPFGLSPAAQRLAWRNCDANPRVLVDVILRNAAKAAENDGRQIAERHVAQALESTRLIEV